MRMEAFRRHSVAALWMSVALVALTARSQEGFPLDGTWRGQWGSADKPAAVVIVMTWDGKNINGLINPGRNSARFSAAELRPSDWTVRFEAAMPSDAGTVPIVIEGKLDDIGSYHRTITGTWTQAGKQHIFKVTRE
jgi:hypothetical protein